MASTCIPLLVIAPYAIFLEEYFHEWIAVSVGFIVMAIPFYWAIKKINVLNTSSMKPVIDYVNATVENTTIEISSTGLQYSMNSVVTHQSYKGILRGNPFVVQYSVSGTSDGAQTHSSGDVQFIVESQPIQDGLLQFNIQERDERWRKIDGNSLTDCFEQRFNCRGVAVADLPADFKRMCLENSRPLYIENSSTTMTYTAKNIEVYPAYTVYGQILFVDFLIELRSILANSKK